MHMRAICVAMTIVAGLAAVPPALAQQQQRVTHYEPSQRLRTGIETCMKDEVLAGAYCVKKCQEDFRLDASSRPALCIATRPNARFEPQKPNFTPPDKPLPTGGSRSQG
jgi:hypothetical protein